MENERSAVIAALEAQLRRLEGTGFAGLIPEVGSNLAYSVRSPKSPSDVAAVPGRIRNAMGKPAFLNPHFGASTHVASTIIEASRHDPSIRSALNIRYSESIVEALEGMGLEIAFVDRVSEPEDVGRREGASVPWVIARAIKDTGRVPDAVYHKGAVGKEPIVQLLGKDPEQVVTIALRLLEALH